MSVGLDKNEFPGINLFDLTGRVAIITGGSKGLGLAMAAGLASAGAHVLLVNRNKEEEIDDSEQAPTSLKREARDESPVKAEKKVKHEETFDLTNSDSDSD
jgi:NAD(P)-dependent dehydrogenase (short-subunit alcohol dehydrogenase family)